MSYKAEQASLKISKKKFTYSLHKDKITNWILSKYQDESQLLDFQELKNYLIFIEGKALKTKNSLFVIKSILKVFREKLAISEENEQKLAIVMLSFVEKAQQEQLKKIYHPYEIANKVLIWTMGNPSVVNTVLRALLHSETLIYSSYLKDLTLWLTSEEQDLSLLLTEQKLQLALNNANSRLSEIENKFLVRSLVFDLRVA
jgi:hypothetical protein